MTKIHEAVMHCAICFLDERTILFQFVKIQKTSFILLVFVSLLCVFNAQQNESKTFKKWKKKPHTQNINQQ